MRRDHDRMKLEMEGHDLDDAATEALAQALAASPDDLDLRIRWLGTLRRRGLPRGEAILWLVTHHPEINLGPYQDGGQLIGDPGGYAAVLAAWEEHHARAPDDLGVLGSLIDFVYFHDPPRAEALLRRCCELAPAETDWMDRLANHLMLRCQDLPDEPRRAMAAEALALRERALAMEPDDLAGHLHLLDVARAAVVAGQPGRASEAASKALQDAPGFERTWQFGNSIHRGNIVLGLVALDAGDREEAVRRLLAAGQTRGSPQLNSFGPDSELASRLLAAGERASVLAYMQACLRFWRGDDGRIQRATEQIERGETPELWG